MKKDFFYPLRKNFVLFHRIKVLQRGRDLVEVAGGETFFKKFFPEKKSQ